MYEGYYTVNALAIIIFISMAVLYSATCLRIYLTQQLRTNASHMIPVIQIIHSIIHCSPLMALLIRSTMDFIIKVNLRFVHTTPHITCYLLQYSTIFV